MHARAGLNKLVAVVNASTQRDVLEQLIASELRGVTSDYRELPHSATGRDGLAKDHAA